MGEIGLIEITVCGTPVGLLSMNRAHSMPAALPNLSGSAGCTRFNRYVMPRRVDVVIRG